MARRISGRAQEDRVGRAYDALSRMAPMLGIYASSYVGKKVRIIPHHQTETDGKNIFIRPPLALANQLDHSRSVCGLRDSDGSLVCEACATHENILTQLHHEIAHIIHGSFERYGSWKIYDDFGTAVARHLPDYMDTFHKIKNEMKSSATATAISLAGALHPHLGMVNMVNEDHRINSASYKVEEGYKKRIIDMSRDILENGVEGDDGSFSKWQDRDPDQQMMIAPLFYMQNLPIAKYFSDEIVEVVYSDKVSAILDGIADQPTSMHVLRDSVKLLALYREAGFFQQSSDPWDDMSDEDREALEAFLKMLRELFRGILGHSDHLGEKGDDIGETGTGAADDIEDPDDGTVAKIIQAKEFLDNTPGHIGGINIWKQDEGPCSGVSAHTIPKASEAIIGKAVAKSRVIFNMNARAHVHRNQKAGRIDARALGKRAWNEGDGRLFKSKTIPDKRNYEVLIGFDISGSTGSAPGGCLTRLEMLKFSACALADTMHRLGVDFSIYAHNTGRTPKRLRTDDWSSGFAMDIYTLKSVDEKWTEKVRSRVTSIGSAGSNLDGNTLQFYRKMLDRSRATDKILMYFTDGVMPGTNTAEELPILKSEIEQCRKRGYTLLGVGVYTDAPVRHGLPTVRVDTEADYPGVIDHLAKRLGV